MIGMEVHMLRNSSYMYFYTNLQELQVFEYF